MKIWITGICGFLGSHLSDALIAEGHEVRGNDSLIGGDPENVATNLWEHVDCCDIKAMLYHMRKFKPDVVVHTAALAHEGLSSFSPSFITKSIYEASISTFSAAIASGATRIVYMSSMARYGNQTPPFTEEMTPKPVDPYGVSKVAAEECLRILSGIHAIKYSILVPHNIIGIRQRYNDSYRNVASIMLNRCLQNKPPIIYGDGMQTRCFSPVRDCVPSIVRAVYGDADGEVVNIGPDKGEITINDLAYRIKLITGYHGGDSHLSDRPAEVKHAFTSSEKVRKLLGYKEQQSVDECLKEMAEHIKLKGTKEFDYDFMPIEITEGCPEVWLKRLL